MNSVCKLLKYKKSWSIVPKRYITKQNTIDVTVNEDGIATLTLKRPPANVLDVEGLQDLRNQLDKISKLDIKGAILTSVGLIELASDNENAIERFKKYIRQFENNPLHAMALTKQLMREEPLKILREKTDSNLLKSILNDPVVQNAIKRFIDELKPKNQVK